MDLALVSVAVSIVQKDNRCISARVAAGAVAPRPMRLRKVEEYLVGHDLATERETLTKARALAEQEVAPITDLRASEQYRRHLTGVLLERAIAVAWKRGRE